MIYHSNRTRGEIPLFFKPSASSLHYDGTNNYMIMNYINRLNQWLDKTVATAQEKVANKRLAKKAKLQLDGEINRVQIELTDIEESVEDLKNSKEFNAKSLWAEQKKTILKEKEIEFYHELKKELF